MQRLKLPCPSGWPSRLLFVEASLFSQRRRVCLQCPVIHKKTTVAFDLDRRSFCRYELMISKCLTLSGSSQNSNPPPPEQESQEDKAICEDQNRSRPVKIGRESSPSPVLLPPFRATPAARPQGTRGCRRAACQCPSHGPVPFLLDKTCSVLAGLSLS